MLRDNAGAEVVESIAVISILVAIGGAMLYAIATTASAEGTNVKSWIDSINVPAAVGG